MFTISNALNIVIVLGVTLTGGYFVGGSQYTLLGVIFSILIGFGWIFCEHKYKPQSDIDTRKHRKEWLAQRAILCAYIFVFICVYIVFEEATK